jgi:uncharacterized protein (DUF952 family)
MILHCLKNDTWEKVKDSASYSSESLHREGFIHCSPVEYFHRVAPNFKDVEDDLILLLLDEEKIESEVRWEDPENLGRAYPHIYGPLNLSAVVGVLPFLRDQNGNFVKNEELKIYPDR